MVGFLCETVTSVYGYEQHKTGNVRKTQHVARSRNFYAPLGYPNSLKCRRGK